jgi:hypothetical protein
MSTVGACIALAATMHVAANVTMGRRLWRSTLFERSQKIAQTLLMVLVPGAFLLVRFGLRDSTLEGAAGTERDPTATNGPGYFTDDVTGYHHGHGDGGGHGF